MYVACYVSRLILDMVPCSFPATSFRSFKEFVPYALRHNQNVQIPLFKKSLAYNFFFRKASSLWNSLPLQIKSSASHSIFMNRLNSYYHILKSAHHLLGLNSHMTSIRCLLSFARSPYITKNNYHVCMCGEMETELHLFFQGNVHCATRTALHNKAQVILNDLNAWVIPICCDYIYGVPDARTSVLLVSIIAFQKFVNSVKNS